ncbi:SURF1 family protein [Massilia niastensis]|uniref:SURF1 family protein n=1 Tax=Massilia niastensis TaxID=544911 RepID=UPI00035F7356|nr:SURF1 family protein [Massilia niastensis]
MEAMHDRPAGPASAQPRGAFARRMLVALALLLIVLFAGLGTWQVVRLQWKLDLIARVNARVHAEPAAPPPAARWPQVSKQSDEYRRVRLSGRYLYEFTTPVQAVSELGAGFWLLTPLCTAEGHIVFINRGFIPAAANKAGRYPARRADAGACATAQEAPVTVTGLLRIAEPGGGFLRENDPVNNRWYSRDVAGMAAARGLSRVAPYFVDAGKDQDPPAAPERAVGGLTVIAFQNNHLVYALTWYALALMVAGAWWWVGRHGANSADD